MCFKNTQIDLEIVPSKNYNAERRTKFMYEY